MILDKKKAPNKFVIGVTGGIGAGKTAVTEQFQQLGIEVVDADEVARTIVQPNQPTLTKIVDTFGKQILLESGQLDRAKLRALIFSDDQQKQKLNNIMFPAIRVELVAQLSNAQSAYVILSAPLLFENGLEQYTDRVLVVDVPETTQIKRASHRDTVSEQQIKSIIKSQISRKDRLNNADDVIDNQGTVENLHEQVKVMHQKYISMVPSVGNTFRT